jgi:methionyl-tRNA synthetase
VHGFLTVGGEKMSKSRGTGVHPFELLDRFGVDSYRYYFMREVPFGQDGSFSWEAMTERHNADLANGLGNLASRVLAMLASSFDGAVPEPVAPGLDGDLPSTVAAAAAGVERSIDAISPSSALTAVWEIVGRANQYLVELEPWKLAKDDGKRDELSTVLYTAAETLRVLAVLIAPFMPSAAARLWDQLGVDEPLDLQRLPAAAAWGGLAPRTKTTKGDALFPRLDA